MLRHTISPQLRQVSHLNYLHELHQVMEGIHLGARLPHPKREGVVEIHTNKISLTELAVKVLGKEGGK